MNCVLTPNDYDNFDEDIEVESVELLEDDEEPADVPAKQPTSPQEGKEVRS